MAIIRKVPSQVVSIENPLEGIYVITLKALEKKFKFKPGQFLHLTLDEVNPSLPWPESRCFSIQSSPEESDIKITFSVCGSYTKRMAQEITVGKELCLKLAYGDLFSKGHSLENCVFIAGGTGVTPYLSLFNSSDFAAYTDPKLYLGVRSSLHNLYQSELAQAKVNNQNFEMDIIDQSISGLLDIKKIFDLHGMQATYFISGPPIMISNFKTFLLEKGISEDRVKTDDWE